LPTILLKKQTMRNKAAGYILLLLIFCFVGVWIYTTFINKPKEEEVIPNTPKVPIIGFTQEAALPHTVKSYTQGLEILNGKFLESSGKNGESKLSLVDMGTGQVEVKVAYDSTIFAEGCTVLDNKIYVLTWQNKKVFVYDAKNFKLLKELPLATEGWGITNDGSNLIVSDGSANLTYYDPINMTKIRTVQVEVNRNPVSYINELEMVNGFIYANVYQTTEIVKINPNTGVVVGVLQGRELAQQAKMQNPQSEEFNGIAYDKSTQHFYLTGKYWPMVYKIKLTN
jgi:glutaminyl-peptide cyclotransferase